MAQAEAEAETTGDRWGDPISEERQAELQGYLDRWQTGNDHGARTGPFDRAGLSDEEQERIKLTGADVFWLAERTWPAWPTRSGAAATRTHWPPQPTSSRLDRSNCTYASTSRRRAPTTPSAWSKRANEHWPPPTSGAGTPPARPGWL